MQRSGLRRSLACFADDRTGEELDAFLARQGKNFDRIVYVGDGTNDFCPILRLRTCVLSIFLTFVVFKNGFSMSVKIWFSAELTADYKSGLKKKVILTDYNAQYSSGEAVGKLRKYLANCRSLISSRYNFPLLRGYI